MTVDGIWTLDKMRDLAQTAKNENLRSADREFQQMLDKALASKEDKELKEAAKQFEALFIYQMFEKMRETVSRGGLFEESMGEKIFQGMLDQEVSLKAAESNSLGLAEMIYQQLKRK